MRSEPIGVPRYLPKAPARSYVPQLKQILAAGCRPHGRRAPQCDRSQQKAGDVWSVHGRVRPEGRHDVAISVE
jgi:hypothetical protein